VECASGETADESGSLRAGVWTHFACTLGDGEVRLYRDGAQVDASPQSGIPDMPAGIWLAENGFEGDDQLVGAIDQVRVWSVIRPPEQIRAEAERGEP